MSKITLISFLCLGLLSFVAAECPNACSAHGKCGAYDMCTCFRNWMSNDCSERVCQFGLAHVDTPKGDLDASSGALTGPDSVVAVNDFVYRFGTTEQYPATKDMEGNVLTNTAHEYRECSNKGICDRNTGTCACFEGYEGSACQRASCPSNSDGVCSGHGTCMTISELATNDHNNIYKLWDEDATMGCLCDSGYTGADCSQRQCKVGTDPLYYDNNQTLRYSNFTYQFYTNYASPNAVVTGNYSLIFYDAFGEDWQTKPIDISADCATIQAALEELPNDVIADGTVRCYKSIVAGTGSYGQDALLTEPIRDITMYVQAKYTLAFPKNPGKLKQIGINKYLDGTRATLYTDESSASTLGWHIYPNGFIGENVDPVPDRCEGVTVTVSAGTGTAAGYHVLGSLTADEIKLLKACLGEADTDTSNNNDVYNWDYGNQNNPHLIKLKDATEYTKVFDVDSNGNILYDPQLQYKPKTKLCDSQSPNADRYGSTGSIAYCANSKSPSFYAVLHYDTDLSQFVLWNRIGQDYGSTTPFWVYTTKGYLQRISDYSGVFTHRSSDSTTTKLAKYHSNQVTFGNTDSTYTGYYGDVSCETNPAGDHGSLDCIQKNDQVILIAPPKSDSNNNALNVNPIYTNLYTVTRIGRDRKTVDPETTVSEQDRLKMNLDYSLNFAVDQTSLARYATSATATVYVYKFYPPTDTPFGGYLHTGPCGTRGVCNGDTGLCECFNGYTKDDCTCINNLVF